MANSVQKVLRSAGKSALGLPTYLKFRRKSGDSGRREIQICLEEFVFSRYFYSLIKFFGIEGFDVAIDAPMAALYSLSRSQYAYQVLPEGLAFVGTTQNPVKVISSRCEGLPRLLVSDLRKPSQSGTYDIPMAQHPMMYAKGFWDRPVGGTPRRAVLFAGNFGNQKYEHIVSDQLFNVIDRITVLRLARELSNCLEITNLADLSRVPEGAVCLADSALCPIEMRTYRDTIGSFHFFLCVPGAFMPLCHNLTEALSVGTIPIIQREYAELLSPVLVHRVNAIIFDSADDLRERIEEALNLERSELFAMRENVQNYYDSHLTPASVVERVLDSGTRVVRMLAGPHSLAARRKVLEAEKLH